METVKFSVSTKIPRQLRRVEGFSNFFKEISKPRMCKRWCRASNDASFLLGTSIQSISSIYFMMSN